MDDSAFAYFERLRQRHFPPNRNHVPAHISLFHHLPGAQLPSITAELCRVCDSRLCIPVQVAGLRNLGGGVAFRLHSPQLLEIRHSLAQTFLSWLTPQDRQRYNPHITVQNKVSKDEAAALTASLHASFTPWSASATGLTLWHYRGGPWEKTATYAFRPAKAPD